MLAVIREETRRLVFSPLQRADGLKTKHVLVAIAGDCLQVCPYYFELSN